MFDGIPISVCTMVESESKTMGGCLQPRFAIDKKDRVDNEMFLAEFSKEHLGQRLRSRRIGAHMEQAVGIRSTAAYSQYRSSLSWLTVSSTAT